MGSDKRALLVLANMRPLLRQGEYDSAVAQGISQIKGISQGSGIANEGAKSIFDKGGFWPGLLFIIGILSEIITCGNGLFFRVLATKGHTQSSGSFGGGGGFELGGGA